jgi:hypothetical protein
VSASGTALAQQPRVFYLIGAEEQHTSPNVPNMPQFQGVHLYEMDSATHVLRSAELNVYSGMLTGDRKTIVLVQGGNEHEASLLLVSIPEFKVRGRMEIPMTAMPMNIDGDYVACLDQIFVHPVTGSTHFSCQTSGRTPPAQIEVDPFHKKVIPVKPPMSNSSARTFLYDPTHQWLYLGAGGQEIFDVHDNLVARIGESREQQVQWAKEPVHVVGIEIPGHTGLYGVRDMALFPDGNLVLLSHVSETPVLSLYDPVRHKVLRTWIEDRTYTGMVVGRIHGVTYNQPTPMQFPYRIENVPVPSRDGSRLFAIEDSDSHNAKHTEDGGILWDARTLQVLRRWALPEPISYDCSVDGTGSGLVACFAPAPDGRGMWYFGKSGKIYRLDDHTGDLIEEVKLPFHFISLIREP